MCASIWAHSSRVGVRMSARVVRRGLPISRWRIGSTKAAVLPLPVAAQASTSRPASAGGIACSWIGVGRAKPSSRIAAQQQRIETERGKGHGRAYQQRAQECGAEQRAANGARFIRAK